MASRCGSSPPKRRPTVLVTDARDARDARAQGRDPNRRPPASGRLPSMVRFISVDNVLQSSPSVPSAQPRGNPLEHLHRARAPHSPSLGPQRTPPPVDPRRQVNQSQNLPVRSSKVSEKLVLLPEPEPDVEDDGARWDYLAEDEEGPLRDEEESVDGAEDEGEVPTARHPPRKSYAERLPKARRADKFSRVTAYCTADAYRLAATSKFLRNVHGARTKLYDECLYVAYHLPLLHGGSGHRIHSSPALKSPGGKAVLDVEIERSEQRDYHEGYFEGSYNRARRESEDSMGSDDGAMGKSPDDHDHALRRPEMDREEAVEEEHRPGSPKDGASMDMKGFAEMFVFSYGVVVFWNFTEKQEKDILADLTFAATDMGLTLISSPLKEEDFESEEFHFEYSTRTRSPRIYNDMITLRSGDIMVKLAISHAIAQSTKLCRFEERMNTTMAGVEHIPRKLALTGTLGLKREEVIKMSGRLFRLRVDVNLSSNVLDVPEFFWDSEPTLHPLYAAVREYLEIKQRILVLNERCRVFLDLADILSDSIADSNMSRITWIIIALIILSICVTVAEVAIRFGILAQAGKRKAAGETARLGASLLGIDGGARDL